jgi:serine/threonine protein kinase
MPDEQPSHVQVDGYTYELIKPPITTGGFGTVWLLRRPEGAAYGAVWGQTRAVKTFNDAYDDETEAAKEQELGNWAALKGQHIVPLIKIVRLNFTLAAMMELMPGTLDDYTRIHGPLNPLGVKTVLLDVFRGLREAERECNLAHLDLKPANLLLTSDPRLNDPPHVQISDWGIARLMSRPKQHAGWLRWAWFGQTPAKTRFGFGTTRYMAPERFSDAWVVGAAADIFSLGLIVVELMTGALPSVDPRYPYDNRRCRELLTSHVYLRRAEMLLAAHQGPLASLAVRMLDPKPARRPVDYPVLIAELERM